MMQTKTPHKSTDSGTVRNDSSSHLAHQEISQVVERCGNVRVVLSQYAFSYSQGSLEKALRLGVPPLCISGNLYFSGCGINREGGDSPTRDFYDQFILRAENTADRC